MWPKVNISLGISLICICCDSFFTKVLAAVPLPTAPLDPDVEILPSASAVSSQYVFRIHNKPIIGPAVAPIIEVDSPAATAPLNALTIPAAHQNLPLTAPLPLLRSPIVPVAQQAAPFVPLPATLSTPSVIPATLFSYATRVFGAPAFPYAPPRLAFTSASSGRLRSRFSYRRRPTAVALRRYPTYSAHQRYG